ELEFILDTGGGALAKTTTYGYDTTFQYDVGFDQTSVSEYAYILVDQNTAQTLPIASLASIPNGDLVRTTVTSYLTSDTNYRSNTRRRIGLPSPITIYNGTVSDPNVRARSTISYDETALQTYTPPSTWIDPQNSYRGNPTTTSLWLNLNAGGNIVTYPNGTYVVTHAEYDQFGNVRTTTDAKGKQSQIEYSPDYLYAYPT